MAVIVTRLEQPALEGGWTASSRHGRDLQAALLR
jgi:hypothetical protein